MKFVSEFRDPEAAKALIAEITEQAADQPPRKFMEACGGHTHVGTRQRAVGLWEC